VHEWDRARRCALDGCAVSLAGRRRNTRFCCDKHRVEDFRRRQALPNGSAPGDPAEALQALRDWLSALPEQFEDRGYEVDSLLDDVEAELSGLEYDVEEYLDEQEDAGAGAGEPAASRPGDLAYDLRRSRRRRAGSVTNGSDASDYDPNRSGSVT
jgi:hypothetical protein